VNAPQRCDACGGLAVEVNGAWVHVDPQQAAQSASGPHDPFKFDDRTAGHLRAVLDGESR
jgi:hypothetical protein